MPNKLTKLEISEVSSVSRGAAKGARVVLMKSADERNPKMSAVDVLKQDARVAFDVQRNVKKLMDAGLSYDAAITQVFRFEKQGGYYTESASDKDEPVPMQTTYNEGDVEEPWNKDEFDKEVARLKATGLSHLQGNCRPVLQIEHVSVVHDRRIGILASPPRRKSNGIGGEAGQREAAPRRANVSATPRTRCNDLDDSSVLPTSRARLLVPPHHRHQPRFAMVF